MYRTAAISRNVLESSLQKRERERGGALLTRAINQLNGREEAGYLLSIALLLSWLPSWLLLR